MKKWRNRFKNTYSETTDQAIRFISPHEHGWILAGRRAQEITRRLFLIVFCFAICTPLWLIIDAVSLSTEDFLEIAVLRLLVSGVFAFIAWKIKAGTASWSKIWISLLSLSVGLSIFHIGAAIILDGSISSPVIARSYEFLPFILIAGLAMLPLTILESLFVAFPAAVAMVVAGMIRHGISAFETIGDMWLFTILTIASIATSLLHFKFLDALSRQAIRDSISGAFSRASGEELIDLQFLLSARASTPLSIAYVDIENFKEKNNRIGRAKCDEILASVAKKLVSDFRKSDMVIRWGGDEMLLIMPNTKVDGAKLAIDRILAEGFENSIGEKVEVSAGIAERITDDVSNWVELISLAEKRSEAASSMGGGFAIGPAT